MSNIFREIDFSQYPDAFAELAKRLYENVTGMKTIQDPSQLLTIFSEMKQRVTALLAITAQLKQEVLDTDIQDATYKILNELSDLLDIEPTNEDSAANEENIDPKVRAWFLLNLPLLSLEGEDLTEPDQQALERARVEPLIHKMVSSLRENSELGEVFRGYILQYTTGVIDATDFTLAVIVIMNELKELLDIKDLNVASEHIIVKFLLFSVFGNIINSSQSTVAMRGVKTFYSPDDTDSSES